MNHEQFTPIITERFWKKVNRTDDDSCWEWTGATNQCGYGVFTPDSKKSQSLLRAHRIAYFLTTGIDPCDLCVCHKCDNRKCCNPSHHFLGTRTENQRDMAAKGRSPHGEKNNRSKYTTDQVLEIRRMHESGMNYSYIARHFSIHRETVRGLCLRTSWRHLK